MWYPQGLLHPLSWQIRIYVYIYYIDIHQQSSYLIYINKVLIQGHCIQQGVMRP